MKYYHLLIDHLKTPVEGVVAELLMEPGITVNLDTGFFSDGRFALDFVQSLGMTLLECRYRLGRGDTADSITSDYEFSSSFGTSCSLWCKLRGISEQVAKLAGLREEREKVLIPYRDIHGNLLRIVYRDALTGKKGDVLGTECIYSPYKSRQPFPIVVLLLGESDVLRFRTELENEGITDIGVYGLPSTTVAREFLREFQTVSRVLVIPTSDLKGTTLIQSVQKIAPQWMITELNWKTGQKGKDFTDWINYSENDFLALIRGIRPQHASSIIQNDGDFIMDTESIPKEWIIENLISKGDIGILGGQQKARKTWLTMTLLKSIVTGTPLWGIEDYVGNPNTRILFIEEEGNKKDFKDRRDAVLSNKIYPNIFWLHDSGRKFDNDSDIEWLSSYCRELEIDFVIADPLQNLRNVANESSAGDVHHFWENVKRLKRDCNLGMLFLHHFNQGGDVTKGWAALRGTTRDAGQADIGFFTDKVEKPTHYNRVCIDGREVHAEYPNGKYFHLNFVTRSLGKKLIHADFVASKEGGIKNNHETLLRDFLGTQKTEWLLTDCAETYGVTEKTIKNWVEKLPELTTTPPSKNNPVKIVLAINKSKPVKQVEDD